MANASRKELIAGLVRDHRVAPEEAERWCRAWETFATVHGRVPGPYFWDEAQGWIDAHLSKPVKAERPKRRRKPVSGRHTPKRESSPGSGSG